MYLENSFDVVSIVYYCCDYQRLKKQRQSNVRYFINVGDYQHITVQDKY